MVLKQIKAVAGMYAHLPRYREIFTVFWRHGFGDVLKLVHLQKTLEIQDSQLPDRAGNADHSPAAERFRMALEELGPTFVKFGQILSTRRDLVSEAVVNELSKLQDQVPSFPGSEARRILESELQRDLEEVFLEFDIHPVASASMAQVHRGVLRNKEVVAVKIQRPDIGPLIQRDLEILMDVARFLEKHVPQYAVLNPLGIVREFGKTILQEQDFLNEAKNMDRFAKQFRRNKTIRIPKVFHEHTTSRVLTMEYFAGWRIDDPAELRRHKVDPVQLAHRCSRFIFQQMFQFGFFHGDPHPGNLTILPGGVLGLYDYGMMGTLSHDFREDIANMIYGLTEKDARLVTRSLLGMSEEGYASDPRKLELDVESFAEQYLDVPLKDLNLGFVLNRLLDLLMEHRLKMLSDFYLGVKALTQVEAIGKRLDPDLNFVQFGKPFALRVIEERYDLRRLFKQLIKSFFDSAEFFKDIPTDARDFYQRIKSGQYRIPLEHRFDAEGFQPLRNTLNHIANRLTNAIVTSSVLICSSILILSGTPPKWHDMPLIGLAGLIIGTVMGIRLFISIWKRGGF